MVEARRAGRNGVPAGERPRGGFGICLKYRRLKSLGWYLSLLKFCLSGMSVICFPMGGIRVIIPSGDAGFPMFWDIIVKFTC